MSLLGRHLLARLAATTLVAAALLAALLLTLQALRLGHHLSHGGLDAALLGRVLLYALPTLALLALPVGGALAALYVWGRLRASGELEALHSLGASPLGLAVPGLLVALGASALAWSAQQLQPRAAAALERTVIAAATTALGRGVAPGVFHRLPGGGVLYAHAREPGSGARPPRLSGVLLARGAGQLLVAQQARLSATAGGLRLALRQGELQLLQDDGRLLRVRFEQMQHRVALGALVAPHFRFLQRAAPLRHAWATTLALIALCTALTFCVRRPVALAAAGLALVAGVTLAQATLSAWWPPGPLLLDALAAGAALALLLWLGRGAVPPGRGGAGDPSPTG